MNGWLRGLRSERIHVVGGCPHAAGARPWRMVEGWDDEAVLRQIEQVPWLRLCVHCAVGLTREVGGEGTPRLTVVP